MPTRLLRVKVKPNARAASLTEGPGGVWQASLRSPPVDGKANAELVALVAERFGRPKSAISIKSGYVECKPDGVTVTCLCPRRDGYRVRRGSRHGRLPSVPPRQHGRHHRGAGRPRRLKARTRARGAGATQQARDAVATRLAACGSAQSGGATSTLAEKGGCSVKPLRHPAPAPLRTCFPSASPRSLGRRRPVPV